MDFDPTRLLLLGSGNCPSYYPSGSKQQVPYIYMDATSINNAVTAMTPRPWWFPDPTTSIPNLSSAGVAMAYTLDANGNGVLDPGEELVSPDACQIISAGLDDIYGVTCTFSVGSPPGNRLYPTDATTYDTSTNRGDDDNVTNFCNKARLIDAKP